MFDKNINILQKVGNGQVYLTSFKFKFDKSTCTSQ